MVVPSPVVSVRGGRRTPSRVSYKHGSVNKKPIFSRNLRRPLCGGSLARGAAQEASRARAAALRRLTGPSPVVACASLTRAMILLRPCLLLFSLLLLLLVSRLRAQEAVEIRGDQENPEPTPIRQRAAADAEPPAESDADAEATPKKKSKGAPTSVEEMSPEEFKRMGLDKLSPDELKTLNEWLRGYRHAAETKAAARATEQTKEQAREDAKAEAKQNFNRSWLSTDRIFSRIDGEFHGLSRSGRKMIIRLEDGTVWKQANETDRVYSAKLTDHPPVMVTHSFVGYKMHVIGAGEFWVNPVRGR